MKNTFDVLSRKDMIGCLRNWESLVYDQSEKTKCMLKNYIELDSKMQERSTSIATKATTTCERCYLNMRKVNVEEVRNCL